MRTLDTRAVRFGELAGPLVHGSAFFDWQLISTQGFAAGIDYPFEQLIADDEIPYAPVFTQTRIDRYPSVGDCIAVETTPVTVGDHRIVLQYEFLNDTDETFGVGQITHVTISSNGRAKPLPETVQARASEHITDTVDSEIGFDAERPASSERTYGDSFRIRRPLIEGSELAYFEEYPRLATIALERYLTEHGISLPENTDDRHPFQLRQWEWNFNAPVAYGTTLDVNATVVDISEETVLVSHTFEQEGQARIEGWTEYGCFDSDGEPIAFDERILRKLSANR
jgi:acyl-CoA thioesterase FadM